jgi:DNA invertase Pin-like site-specific DNA recombinase
MDLEAPTLPSYMVVTELVTELSLGFRGERLDFCWKSYANRRPDQRADYDRLIVSIFHDGIRRPLITFGGHVLIGMRRAEIARRLGISSVCCWRILEDVAEWHGSDLERLEALKVACGATRY